MYLNTCLIAFQWVESKSDKCWAKLHIEKLEQARNTMALSNIESEYMALSKATTKAIWLGCLLPLIPTNFDICK